MKSSIKAILVDLQRSINQPAMSCILKAATSEIEALEIALLAAKKIQEDKYSLVCNECGEKVVANYTGFVFHECMTDGNEG